MVAKGVVLLGVQHFQQRAGRITPEVGTQLVDFVQQEQRVASAHLAQILQNLARHGTDVGAAMPPDFGLVAHAAQGHTHIFAPGGLGHRLPQRGLAHARRAHQAQNRRLHLVHALLHCKVFQDAVLDLFQTVVVFVQHLFGQRQVVLDLGFLVPGQ